MCSRYIVLLTGFAVCTSAEVISEDCKDHNLTATKLETFYDCCDLLSTFNETEVISQEVEDAMKFCREEFEKANNVSDDVKLPPASEGHDCYFECILKKTGAMREDLQMNKERLNEWLMEGIHEDFQEAGKQAMEKCYNKNYSKQYCASGIMGLLSCHSEELIMNCPATYWDSSANCTEAKAYMKKCPFYQHMIERGQL